MNKKRITTGYVFLIAMLLTAFPWSASAAINPMINYQGRLTDSAGTAVADDSYNMRFMLYTSASGGAAIFTETLTGDDAVPVTGGLFSVMIGSTTDITGVDFNQTLYLGVEIGGTDTVTPDWDGEMTPRKIIGSVPSAFVADTLDGLDSTQFLRSDADGTLTGDLTISGNSTTTSATTTNLFSTTASSTNLFSTSGNIGSLVAGSLTTGAVTSGLINSQTISSTANFTGTLTATGGLTTLSNLLLTGSSTLQNFTFVNATGTNATTTNLFSTTGTFATLCLTGDTCRTTWPSGGGSTFPFTATSYGVSTSTIVGFEGGLMSLGSTTIYDLIATRSTTTNATTTNFRVSDYLSIGGTGGRTTIDANGLFIEGGLEVNSGNTVTGSLFTGDLTVQGTNFTGPASSTLNRFTFTNATGSSATTTSLYVSTHFSGAGLSTCNTSVDKLLWVDGTFSCGTDQSSGGGGTDTNWTFFNNSGLRLATTSNQVVLGATSTSTLSKLEIVGGLSVDNSTTTNATTTNLAVTTLCLTGDICRTTWPSGGGSTFPFTATSYGVSTSTIVGFEGGLMSLGSTTIYDLIATRSTTTNATTTNFFATTASSTNLFSSLLNIGSNALVVNSSGNVGIGEEPGTSKLEVNGSILVENPSNASTLVISTDNNIRYDATTAQHVFRVNSADKFVIDGGATYVYNDLSVETTDGATTRLFVDVSSGNIGIGTTTPQWKLQLADSAPQLTLSDSSSLTSNHWSFRNAGGVLYLATSSPSTFSTSSVSILALNGNSNSVSINGGTPSSENVFLVKGKAQGDAMALEENNSTKKWGLGVYSQDFRIGEQGVAYRLTILDSTGYVGIGSGHIAPQRSLDVFDSSSPQLRLSQDITATDYTDFQTNSSGNLTITPSGGFSGFGTNSPNYTLEVQGTASTTSLYATNSTTTNATTTNLFVTSGNFDNINVSQYSGYKINNTLILSASSTNFSTLVGQGAGESLLSDGIRNTALGYRALNSVTSGDQNTAVGYGALESSDTSGSNTAVGYSALNNNNTGFSNTGVGSRALEGNTGGFQNAAFGVSSQFANSTGGNNSSFGAYSMENNTTGSSNTAIGTFALRYNQSATGTTALGYSAGRGSDGGFSNQRGVYVGYEAGVSLETGSDANTFVGYQSGQNNTTGENNVFMGTFSAVAVTTGSNNIALGYNSANNLTTGSNNIILGYSIDAPSATASNQLNIGNLIFGTGINGTETTLSTGNIGIGTNSPNFKLEVQGTASTTNFFTTNSTTTNATSTNFFTTTASSTNLFASLLNIGSNALTVNSSGQVGVRTASPFTSSILSIGVDASSDNSTNAVFMLGTTDLASPNANGTYIGTNALSSFTGNFIDYQLNGTRSFAVDGDGEITTLGGGTASLTSTQLALYQPNGTVTMGNSGDFGTGADLVLQAGAGGIGSNLDFVTDNTTRARLNSSGFGIGTTTPEYTLDVYGFVNTNQYSGYKQAGNTILYASSTGNTTLVGQGAGGNNLLIDSAWSTAVGYNALSGGAATGDENTAVGHHALRVNTSGYRNTAVGASALDSTTSGFENTAMGRDSLDSNSEGSLNSAFGSGALSSNTTAWYNTAIGAYSLAGNVSGRYNAAVGYLALNGNTTGYYNTGLGTEALRYNQSATGTVAIGYEAGSGTANYSNENGVYIGYQSGNAVTTGSDNNTFVGYSSGSANTSGSNNTLFGYQAGNNITTGSNNLVLGYDIDAPSATGSNQLNIGNIIFGTSIDGTGTTLSTGNIGIGTTTPVSHLTIATTSVANAAFPIGLHIGDIGLLAGDAEGTYFGMAAPGGWNGDLALWQANNSTAFRLEANGTATFGNTVTAGGSVSGSSFLFGGTSSSFPALSRSSTDVVIELADGTDGAGLLVTGSTTLQNFTSTNSTTTNATTTSLAVLNLTQADCDVKALTTGVIYCGTDATGSGGASTDKWATSSNPLLIEPNSAMGVNVSQYSGYHIAGNLILHASSTNFSTLVGQGAGENLPTDAIRSTAVGYQALGDTTTGDDNTAIGYQALTANTTGANNIAVGTLALGSNTTGTDNVAVGEDALRFNTSGLSGTSIGFRSLQLNTTGTHNTAVGNTALQLNTTGSQNTAVGSLALAENSTGSFNAVLGLSALQNNQSATSTVAIGYSAAVGGANYSSQRGTYVGYQSGQSVLTGSDNNTFVGYNSGNANTTGANNTLFGYASGDNITTGSNNLVLGYDIDAPSATGSNQLNIGNIIFGTSIDGTGTTLSTGNLGIGTTTPGYKLDVYGFVNTNQYSGYKQAGNTILYASSTNFSTLVGQGAGSSIASDGTFNTAVGYDSLTSITTADSNTALGYRALRLTTTSANTAVGAFALDEANTGSDNTAIGFGALGSNTSGVFNTAVGSGALGSNTDGSFNNSIGYTSMANNTSGSVNNAFGNGALTSNTTGNRNSAFGGNALNGNTSGEYNTAMGESASRYNTSAAGTVALGYAAGQGNSSGFSNTGSVSIGYRAGLAFQTGSNYNTLLGFGAGNLITTGANNILIGANSDETSNNLTTGSNNISIGYNIALPSATASNQLNIGNIIFGTSIDGSDSTLSTGNIGIGTTTPRWKLQIASASTPQLTLSDAGSITADHWSFRNAGGNFYLATSSPTTFATSTSAALSIDTNGTVNIDNLSIGDASVAGDAGTIFGAENYEWVLGYESSDNSFRIASSTGFGTDDILTIAKTTGYVGIGTTTPGAKLNVIGALCVDDTSPTCGNSARTDGTIYSVAALSASLDLAESYPTKDDTLSAGEIVMLDGGNEMFVSRADGDSDMPLVGIVSTNPGFWLGGFNEEVFADDIKLPIALSGRVPTKVNDEGGNIEVGDLITISSIDGEGRKATSTEYTVGIALEDMDDEQGTIEVFVNLSGPTKSAEIVSLQNRMSILELNLASASFVTSTTSTTTSSSIVATVLEAIGATVQDAVTYFKNLVVEALTVGSAEKPTGITLFDTVTNEPYCLMIKNGEHVSEEGECGSAEVDEQETNNNEQENNEQDDIEGGSDTATTTDEIVEDESGTASTTDETTGNEDGNDNGGEQATGDYPVAGEDVDGSQVSTEEGNDVLDEEGLGNGVEGQDEPVDQDNNQSGDEQVVEPADDPLNEQTDLLSDEPEDVVDSGEASSEGDTVN